MNIFSFFSLFKTKQKTLKLPDSLLIKKLKELSQNNSLSIYENITIYHHTQSFFIPLLILDSTRGIYLFEYKEWSYNDLKKATVSKATNQDSSNKSLAYEKTHEFIKQKFNELTHNDGVPIYNYLLMENLNSDEYEHLDDSFKELLPKQKIMFNDSSKEEILEKLKETPLPTSRIPDEAHIMGNLLVQYLIFSKDSSKHPTMHLATKEQIEFIESNDKGLQTLCGTTHSGKTNSILLKAVLENLRRPELKIIIIEPTTLSCDILREKLLNIIEYAIIEIDITSIEIITPIDLLNKHLSKLKKPHLERVLHIENKLMQKNFNVADLIMCDDSDLLSVEFIDYLKHLQRKSSLLLVSANTNQDAAFKFEKSFKNKNLEVIFKQTNQYAKALQIISNLLKHSSSNEILVISSNESKENLSDDLEFFVKDKAISLDSSDNLLSRNQGNLLLCSYAQISAMNSKFVILLDVEEASLNEVEYALNLAEETAFVLYEEERENIKKLKENYV